VDEIARQCRFLRRRARKITPQLFLQGAVLLVSQSAVSLSRWAAMLGVLSGNQLAKQSLWERINAQSVEFLRQILGATIAERAQGRDRLAPEALQAFNRVLIQDSTTIRLTARLAAMFPGSSNQRGAKKGLLKIQAVYELLSQRFVSFGLSGFTRNDQTAARDLLPLIQPGDLILRDLGYFVLEAFEQIVQAGAFFMSRIRLDLAPRDVRTGKAFNLLAALTRQGCLDRMVLLGTQNMRVRLVAIPLPPAVSAERRRRAKMNRDRRCKPKARSLQLMGWAIFITNVPPQVTSLKTVARIYGLRWRIETMFKAWKSHFGITEVPKGSDVQLQAMIYARLLFIALLAQIDSVGWHEPRQQQLRPPASLIKIAALLGQYFLPLCLEAWNIRMTNALWIQIDYHGRYDLRQRGNFVEDFSKLS
jgi:Transposase DDE domain